MAEIVVYSASWCNPCKALKTALDAEDMKYTVVDIDSELDKAKEAQVRGVPTIIIMNDEAYEKRIVGFDRNTISKIKAAI